MKVGDIVKLKNPKNREKKRRWRVVGFATTTVAPNPSAVGYDEINIQKAIDGLDTGLHLRRLDTATHRLERLNEDVLVPVSWWERIWRRW